MILSYQNISKCWSEFRKNFATALPSVRGKNKNSDEERVRDADRANFDIQIQIDNAQVTIDARRVSDRQHVEQLRRDLKRHKMDLVQENRYRELKDAFRGVF